MAPRWQKPRHPSYRRARKQNIPPTVVWHNKSDRAKLKLMKNWITTKIKLDVNNNEINRFLFKTYTIDSKGNALDETSKQIFGLIDFKK